MEIDENSKNAKKQMSNGIKVRDMIRRYDTAMKTDSTKTSYSSIVSSKPSYYGVNSSSSVTNSIPNSMFVDTSHRVSETTPENQSNASSNASEKTLHCVRSPTIEMENDAQTSSLETQKSFMNLLKPRDPPRAAPREKKPRPSAVPPVPPPRTIVTQDETNLNISESSYQSKTTISKTPSGVRIIIDIFFDQKKGLTIEDVVGSRVETDIPPSKILTEFQKRVAESSRD